MIQQDSTRVGGDVAFPSTMTLPREEISVPNPLQRRDLRISFVPPSGDISDSVLSYPVVRFPSDGSPLLLPREGRSDAYPYLLERFLPFLSRLGEVDGLEVTTRCHLPVPGRSVPYEPMAVVCGKELGLYVDVEIDAPYDGVSRIPLHCSDDDEDTVRDTYLASLGWTVVRFTERQVLDHPSACVGLIEAICRRCLGQGERDDIASALSLIPPSPLWNSDGAAAAESAMQREKYLSCQIFPPCGRTVRVVCRDERVEGFPGTGESVEDGRKVSGEEFLSPPTLHEAPPRVQDPLCGRIPSRLLFDEQSHTYIPMVEGAGTPSRRISVTTLISKFFPPFDEEGYIRRKVGAGGMSEEEARAELLSHSLKGTYMHRQAELFLKGEPCDTSSPEMGHFLTFYEQNIRRRNLIFDSAEYPVELPGHDIAGTVDALFRRPDGQYVMVDWKRSTHLVVDGFPRKYGYGSGLGPLSHLDNSSYYHYELQQSFYKYILEKDYGIRVSSMILAVLHPSYDRPYAIRLQDYRLREVLSIIEAWESRC